ncbi:ferrochelatase [Thiocystis violascens]|uniref:Ferrochelatase n=1 Tax=Thiocystis violascens (strain ATCC 17096 / DSM 198 / 6111) TaxID=765911 RepID=I3Y9D9_THIV6|nr:ferrochelatase [Thiocystis violascens]AFL73607.1 ferrochelatase [Thiocystis violascens DSM 198]
MTFVNTPDYRHDTPECLGILLTNLGTPDTPSVPDVRRYLAEFLWDPRVVEMARLPWWLILHGVILRTRPARSAKAYQSVWTADGSPLLAIARRQATALQGLLSDRFQGSVKVALGMRYGNPSISSALAELRQANARRVLVFPLYPQYSGSTVGSAFDAIAHELTRWRWLPELRFINQYHDEPGYIDALAASIRDHWAAHGEPERLLFSFHGIPVEYFEQGDPYHCQCQKTARLVAERLELAPERWFLSFQSRLGKQEWLKPYTDVTLKDWGAAGVKSVQVLSPGFSADCLETIEEIDEENRHLFLDAGGRDYSYIPCLNDRPDHLEMLADLIARHGCGWPELIGPAAGADELARRVERARGMGAADQTSTSGF